MTEAESREIDATVRTNTEETEIRETDIVFDCPHCGKNLVIDYRGAGLQIHCSQCGETVLVPIPDGMELADLDLDQGEILKQLFATRRNFQKAEQRVAELEARLVQMKARLVQMQEALGALQEVVAEGITRA